MCSRTLWVSPTYSPVRLGISPAATSTPTGVVSQWFEALFPCAGTLGCDICHPVYQLLPHQPAAPLSAPLHNPPPRCVHQTPPCCESSPPSPFICPSILNDNFAGQNNLRCRSLPFMTSNTFFQPLLACKISFEKSADIYRVLMVAKW